MKWKDRASSEDTWMLSKEFVECFSSYQLEGKLGLKGEVLIGIIRLIIVKEGSRESRWRL